jgi:hypothetical protein
LSEDRNTKIEEILEDRPVTERWVSADEWIIHDGTWQSEEKFWSRNYYLFSILADVRNSGDVEPIDYPRGVPEDASSGYRYSVDRWEGDGHSHSYFTLAELLDVDWDKYDTQYLEEFMKVIGNLKTIDPDPNKVRICFFFDN